jgi:hypothetical protein
LIILIILGEEYKSQAPRSGKSQSQSNSIPNEVHLKKKFKKPLLKALQTVALHAKVERT